MLAQAAIRSSELILKLQLDCPRLEHIRFDCHHLVNEAVVLRDDADEKGAGASVPRFIRRSKRVG